MKPAIRTRAPLVVAVAISSACGSLGPGQVPVQEQPVAFADAQSGAPIARVLLIPKYGVSTGVSTGGGHGPGKMIESSFLASPVMYESGHPLRLQVPDSRGIQLGPVFFVGRGMMLDGALALAPGYQGAWFWQLWQRERGFEVHLQPLGSGSAAHAARLLTLLEKSTIRGSDLSEDERRVFSLSPDFHLGVKLTSDERRMIRSFLLPASKF